MAAGRLQGGQIQVSMEGKNGPWQLVFTLGREKEGQWSEINLSNLPGPYKAFRYVSPNRGYGNVAELEFYNGSQKLTGTVFADGGGSWNGLQDRTAEKAFDGNVSTFYDANNANGAFVGLELTGCNTSTNRLAAEVESAEPVWALRVAPNPSAGRMMAQVEMPRAGRLTFTLSNVLGQTVTQLSQEGIVGPNAVSLDFSTYPSGIYLLRVQTEGQKSLVQKLFKRTD
ncbi:MAG: T9SS type A sorting domain-containing protein [Cytophagaceae bacterium]|nr:T9SS type A sorting domain-containing protein [Cytophagaceae bacterium]